MSSIDAKVSKANSSKRLPIMFCLDVSPSMGYKEDKNKTASIELLNAAVACFIQQLKENAKIKMAAEIAYVTFSSGIVDEEDFKPVNSMSAPVFEALEEGGTQMADAVIRSIEIIESRVEYLKEMKIGVYAPFLVLITDGSPDNQDNPERQKLAMEMVRQHCDFGADPSKVIVPFVIGVGDLVSKKTLTGYASGFAKGYFPIRGVDNTQEAQFSRVFQLIGNSARTSLKLGREVNEMLSSIRASMNTVLDDFSNE